MGAKVQLISIFPLGGIKPVTGSIEIKLAYCFGIFHCLCESQCVFYLKVDRDSRRVTGLEYFFRNGTNASRSEANCVLLFKRETRIKSFSSNLKILDIEHSWSSETYVAIVHGRIKVAF